METYSLTITKTEEGVSIKEEGAFSEFELIGVLTHLVQQHSLELTGQIKEYENTNVKGK